MKIYKFKFEIEINMYMVIVVCLAINKRALLNEYAYKIGQY